MAKHEGDNIVFLLDQRHATLEYPELVPFDSEIAEPMRQALLGYLGSLVGLDYRSESVLAAYEPVTGLNMGVQLDSLC